MFKQTLVLALVVGVTAPLAQADLVPGQAIDIRGSVDGTPAWGSLFQPPHLFGGVTVYTEFLSGGVTPVTVTSFELPPPPGKKFAGQIDIQYQTSYLDGFPHIETVDIFGIKEPGQVNFINSVKVLGSLSGVADISTDGFNIHFEADSFLIAFFGGNTVSIVWTQSVIPAPGSLALLGLAGLCGRRRRR